MGEARGRVRSHRDLVVWRKAMNLVKLVYPLASELPATERHALASQMTRSAVSVPANIAEGNARGTRREYIRFINIARGSLMETETYLDLIVELEMLPADRVRPALELLIEVDKMLLALRSSLKSQLLPLFSQSS